MEHRDTGQLQGIRVLLVDDSELVIHLVERQLKKWGVDLTVAHDGLEGVHRAAGGHFDLVLMDVNLPGMDGTTAALEIQKFRSTLPIIAITGDDEAPSVFVAHVHKPVQAADLYMKMVKAITP